MKKSLTSLILLLVACGIYFPMLPVFAQTPSSAEQVQISTPEYKPEKKYRYEFGTWNYSVSWQGIPAASASITLEPDGDYFRITASAKTAKGIDVFYRLRYRAEGVISAADMQPVKSVFDQKERWKKKHTEISFGNDGTVRAWRQTSGEDTKKLEFNPRNFMLDPFSAAFLARTLSWNTGDTRQFDIFNGKSRYLISLTAAEKKIIEVGDKEKECWVIVPKVVNLVNAEQTKKLREARIYVTADEKREIVRIESKVFIGTVTTALDSFDAMPERAVVMAKNQGNRIVR